MVVTLGQQYNTGERPTVMLYTYINRHAGTPDKKLSGFAKKGYVCMVTHIARVWINRVRLPALHVVSRTGKINISLSAFVPENLVSRDGLGSPVPRQPAHLRNQAQSGAYLRDSSRVPRRRPFIHL